MLIRKLEAGLGAFFSPLSANIYFPALNPLATELDVSQGLINLTLTSYMIFQGLAPTFMFVKCLHLSPSRC